MSVDRIPEDPEARQAWLASWAAQRGREIDQRAAPLPARIRRSLRARTRPLTRASARCAERLLDRGLDTSRHAQLPVHEHDDRVRYVPSPWHVLPRALRYLGASGSDTFVDFGCGKGRVVHQAARRPLRRVIGVEISTELADRARATVAARRHRHRCRDVEIVVSDVTAFRVPDDLTIAYMFDPFRGETLEAVLQAIIASIDRRPRTVRLIYVHPEEGARVLATGRFRLLKEQRGGLRDVRISRAAIFESR